MTALPRVARSDRVMIGGIVLAILGGLAIIAAVIWWYSRDTRSSMNVREFGADVFLADSQADLVDVTRNYCAAKPHCVQAVKSRSVLVARFDSKEAVREARRPSDGSSVASDWFVIEYLRSDISAKDRRYVESGVNEVDVTSPD